MAKPSGPPHAGHQLAVTAAAAVAAHGQAADAAAAVAVRVGELVEASRKVKSQRRAERLAAIEARNKDAASSRVVNPAG